jgi:hypothetical protein
MEPEIKLHNLPDGACSVSVGGSWISAIFESAEAALSWRDRWTEAESEFQKVNGSTGKGNNLLGFAKTPKPLQL